MDVSKPKDFVSLACWRLFEGQVSITNLLIVASGNSSGTKCEADDAQRPEDGIMGSKSERLLKDRQAKLVSIINSGTAEDLGRTASLICTTAFPKEPWPLWLQPMPDILLNVVTGPESNNKLAKAFKGLLQICFVIDPVLYASTTHHPDRVGHSSIWSR